MLWLLKSGVDIDVSNSYCYVRIYQDHKSLEIRFTAFFKDFQT